MATGRETDALQMVLESSCTILSVLLSNEVLEQYNKQEVSLRRHVRKAES